MKKGFLIIDTRQFPVEVAPIKYYDDVSITEENGGIKIEATERKHEHFFDWDQLWLTDEGLENNNKNLENPLVVIGKKPQRSWFRKTGKMMNHIKQGHYLLKKKIKVKFESSNYKII